MSPMAIGVFVGVESGVALPRFLRWSRFTVMFRESPQTAQDGPRSDVATPARSARPRECAGMERRCSPARWSCAAPVLSTAGVRRLAAAAGHHAVDDGRSEVSQAAAIAVAQPARIVIA